MTYKQECDNEIKETFGFKSRKCPPPCSNLIHFEKDLSYTVTSLKFRHVKDSFQTELNEDIRKIKSPPNDHKDNFRSNPTCRLINLSENELEKVSKQLAEKINSDIIEKLLFNQWRNNNAVLKWFNNITDKSNCSFVQFDIKEFYPSITENILHQTFKFEATYKYRQERPTHHKPLPQVVTIF